MNSMLNIHVMYITLTITLSAINSTIITHSHMQHVNYNWLKVLTLCHLQAINNTQTMFFTKM
jgi:hypothetical protein